MKNEVMRLRVKTEKLVDALKCDRDREIKTYEKEVRRWEKELENYKKDSKRTGSPPYRPTDHEVERLDSVIKMLNLHTEATIEMSYQEYNTLRGLHSGLAQYLTGAGGVGEFVTKGNEGIDEVLKQRLTNVVEKEIEQSEEANPL